MPLVASRANASAKAFGFSAALAGEELGGMVLMTPSSIASTGTGNSSSIGANGSVTFSSCATLSLNGVFTTDYDNYILVMRTSASGGGDLNFRMRLSGTDSTTGYTYQYLRANNTTVTALRATSQTVGLIGAVDITGTTRDGHTMYLYGPNLAQPTATRSVEAWSGYNNPGAEIYDFANTHSVSTAYDGITIYPGSGSITGLVSVYGLVGA